MTVVIAGCGDLGTEAGLRLSTQGHHVVGLRRRPELLPDGIEGRQVDLATQVPEIPSDTELLVVATAADDRAAEAYRSIYLDGLTNLLYGLDRSRVRPRRVVLVSSTAVYGDCGGAWVDESTEPDPDASTAGVLRTAEQFLHARLPDAVVLRLAGLYGPGRRGLIDRVRSGTVDRPSGRHFTNRIHRDDAADAIVHLLTAAVDLGPVYLGCDHEPTPRGEVEEFVARELDIDASPTAADQSVRTTGRRCRNALLVSTGFRFAYPTYREGYRSVLAGAGTRHP